MSGRLLKFKVKQKNKANSLKDSLVLSYFLMSESSDTGNIPYEMSALVHSLKTYFSVYLVHKHRR